MTFLLGALAGAISTVFALYALTFYAWVQERKRRDQGLAARHRRAGDLTPKATAWLHHIEHSDGR